MTDGVINKPTGVVYVVVHSRMCDQLMPRRGLVMWGEEVQGVLDDARLLIQQAASQHGPGLVSILIEGAPNSGEELICKLFDSFHL